VTPPAPRRPIAFNLETQDVRLVASSTAGNTITLNPRRPGWFRLERGEPDTVVFDLPGGEQICELWLPHNAKIQTPRRPIPAIG
jgi:hypothetical protein